MLCVNEATLPILTCHPSRLEKCANTCYVIAICTKYRPNCRRCETKNIRFDVGSGADWAERAEKRRESFMERAWLDNRNILLRREHMGFLQIAHKKPLCFRALHEIGAEI